MMITYNKQQYKSTDGKILNLETPDWSSIELPTVIPELTKLLKEEEQLIEQVAGQKPSTYLLLHTPFVELHERTRRLWGPINHLNSVGETEELLAIIEEGERMMSEVGSRAIMHEGLYHAYSSYRDQSPEYKTLDKEKKKIIDDRILDFELGGVALTPENKSRMTEIRTRLTELSTQVESNVKATVSEWNKLIEDETDLDGVPNSVREAMHRAATAKGLHGWLVTLHAPIYGPVITHATDSNLRKELYVASVTRASEQGPHDKKYNNMGLIAEILRLRDEQAGLLGYTNFAELVLQKRMAPSTKRVEEFLLELAEQSKAKGVEEFAMLTAFAKNSLGLDKIEPWDFFYVSEKFQKQAYDFSQEDLRPYFSQARTLDGVFGLVSRLYGAKVEEAKNISTWRNDVKFYVLYDKKGDLRGGFYADLFARDGKNQGAWMDVLLEREEHEKDTQLPVAYLNCNFTEPKEGEEATMLHGEVETLFHEFGHVLHHVFSHTKNKDSSMNGVEWDAIECPSQVNENWAWEKSMLQSLSQHVETKVSLPVSLMDKLLATKHHLAATMLLRQIELALIDYTLHTQKGIDPLQALEEIRSRVRITPFIPEDRMLASFTHIFAGGYAAGYYSYLWAEVLASDLFEAFTETGDSFNKDVGARFLSSVLEVGSSRPFMESYLEFRGREPSPSALLRLRGLASKL